MTSAYTLDMSSMSPMTTWSAAATACEDAYTPSNVPNASKFNLRMISLSFLKCCSNAQVFLQQSPLRSQLGSSELLHYQPALHDVESIRQRRRKAKVLLDQHHCHSFGPQGANDLAEFLHNHRREPL